MDVSQHLRYHSTSVNHLCKQSGDLNVFYQTGMLLSTISALDRAGLQLDISSGVTGLDLNLLNRVAYMHLPNSNINIQNIGLLLLHQR